MNPAAAVTGTTRIVPLLAYPVTHVRTPSFANAELARREIDALVIPWQTAPHALADVVDALRAAESVAGLIVTVPHKMAVAALCDELSADAAALGAVNVVRRDADGNLSGDILDGAGFVGGLARKGHELAGRSVLLLGAGGAASAIALALARQPIKSLVINNRSADKATRLAAVVGALTGKAVSTEHADVRRYDIVINATGLGMKADDPLPISPLTLGPDQLVAEAVMSPPMTALLIQAQQRGARIHLGEHMIHAQLSLLIDFLFGDA